MPTPDAVDETRRLLRDANIEVIRVDERKFPGEHWLVAFVSAESLTVAQSLASTVEQHLNNLHSKDSSLFTVVFRVPPSSAQSTETSADGGRLARDDVTRLIQLLEARSRTSDALPSLSFVEDPRASLAAVVASRHHLIYGRRGVGKTTLLLEAKRIAENSGHIAVWINAHVLRRLDAASSFIEVAVSVLEALINHGGSSESPAFRELSNLKSRTHKLSGKALTDSDIAGIIPSLNRGLRKVLRHDVLRIYLFVDDFYLLPADVQPQFLDYVFGMLRDTDGWIKVASIERLTRPFEPSTKMGLEIPHDASRIDLDITLEDPRAAQHFLESVLANYTATAGVKQPSSIAKPEALSRLVIASGGVPRDYLNLFASSIVVARGSRPQAREIGREDVAKAANESSQSKKRDLEQDVSSEASGLLLAALERVSSFVKGEGYAYFRVNMADNNRAGYKILAQLVDLRFMHLIQSSLSDQSKAGVKYEAYILDLSEYAGVRLKRSLEVLDLEAGAWFSRLTGKAGSKEKLVGTKLRDKLRRAPLVHVDQVLLNDQV
ncbi:hypothetical protein [Nocardia brasiliensis]|uniref:hypothetical protein n=1 Tax=Nocardia brasiliensis TaxID=37326 RepID=UPI002454C6EE|nr:hypothetical protein [Nocardia brasiliensis]